MADRDAEVAGAGDGARPRVGAENRAASRVDRAGVPSIPVSHRRASTDRWRPRCRRDAPSGPPGYLNPPRRSPSSALVCSCDTSTVAGRRDRAVLMLMARLGLRSGEVARLRLDDVAWRSGEIVVAGKGGRVDRLPLPVDVGDAIVAYLQDGRPVVPWRNVFVALRAPFRALQPSAMNGIVNSASRRAGVEPVTPHQLRHSAAHADAGGRSVARRDRPGPASP